MTLDKAPIRIRRFWRRFDPEWAHAARFYEAFRVGFDDAHADTGAQLIMAGTKTTTSSLLWEYEESGRSLPTPGAVSVLLDGRHQPVCLVESSRVEVIPFDQVDEPFCAAYAESDGTIAGWRALNWPIYQARCDALGRVPHPSMPLVCEHLRVIFPT